MEWELDPVSDEALSQSRDDSESTLSVTFDLPRGLGVGLEDSSLDDVEYSGLL